MSKNPVVVFIGFVRYIVEMGVYDVPFWSPRFYDHKARWIHYFNQIRAVAHEIARRDEAGRASFSVLEVGPSHGLVTGYLKKFGVAVKTLDVKPEYAPDFLGSVLSIPVADNSFEMSIACEVLEHLPFEDFSKALRELRRVTRGALFMSVPDARMTLFGAVVKLPLIKEIAWTVRFPTLRRLPPAPSGAHQWEIGMRGFPVRRVLREIRHAGLRIRSHSVRGDTPRNHYFVLDRDEAEKRG